MDRKKRRDESIKQYQAERKRKLKAKKKNKEEANNPVLDKIWDFLRK